MSTIGTIPGSIMPWRGLASATTPKAALAWRRSRNFVPRPATAARPSASMASKAAPYRAASWSCGRRPSLACTCTPRDRPTGRLTPTTRTCSNRYFPRPQPGHDPMYPHRIRLRGPYSFEPLARISGNEPLPPAGRVTMPARWGESGLRGFAGRVRFRRSFGYPGRIDAEERVWLTFAGVEGVAEVRLNGHDLGQRDGALGPFEFEVTPLLQVRNELEVDVEAASDSGGLWGDVALEIRRTAYLRSVRLWATRSGEAADLHVAGEVVGTCDGSLDLYLLLDN